MKVLTIKQPFASLIINKYKEYEFRSWKTNYRGKILIHSSKNYDSKYINKYNNYNLDYKYGYILGEAILSDCILIDKEFNNTLLRKNKLVYGNAIHYGKYAWKLENIIKYDIPIPAKGKLGLWEYDCSSIEESNLNKDLIMKN